MTVIERELKRERDELFAALERLVSEIDKGVASWSEFALGEARAALAKARGEKVDSPA